MEIAVGHWIDSKSEEASCSRAGEKMSPSM
jgi:hypothetical protein